MRFGRKSKRALVLGCGPAGLFATHGLAENGWDVRVFSNKRKSHLYGAQYLHEPIPGLTPPEDEPIRVKYVLIGDAEDYRVKVYGSMTVDTSVEVLEAEHDAWDIRTTYQAAWDRYEDRIIHLGIDKGVMGMSPEIGDAIDFTNFDVVLSSIPLDRICYRSHKFHSADIWAMGDAPDRGQRVPYRPEPGIIECNGSEDSAWYRASNVYGHVTMEWPHRSKPPLPGVAEVLKPIYSDCDCYQHGELKSKFIPIGRYGSWQKSVLTHHSYTQAVLL